MEPRYFTLGTKKADWHAITLFALLVLGLTLLVTSISVQKHEQIFRCLDGIQYEVKNGKELHIVLHDEHAVGCKE